jgi:hypothetical protein
MTQESASPSQINTKLSWNEKEQPKIASVVTKSFVKTFFQTPKFQNMIAARSA